MSMLLRKARDRFDLNEEKINHLQFMDDLKLYAKSDRGLEYLVNTVRVFSQDVGTYFGVTKCGNLERGESYKYLGVL